MKAKIRKVYKIEEGVPIPSSRPMRNDKKFLEKLEVGQSIFLPNAKIKNVNKGHTEQRTGFRFICRAMGGGVRVWRIQ